MKPSRNLTIGIFGHYGNENMGDEAIVAAVIEEIRSRHPQSRILGFSIVPEDTRLRHGIESFSIRRRSLATEEQTLSLAFTESNMPVQGSVRIRQIIKRIPAVFEIAKGIRNSLLFVCNVVAELGFLLRSYRALKQVDLLLVSGSGQLTDDGGPWGFPYTLYKWSLLATWTDCQLAFIGVGAGPLVTPMGRWFDKHTLQNAGYRSYRDESSYRLVNTLGDFKSDIVCPDLAFGKRCAPAKPIQTDGSPIVVGINPMAYHDPRYWPNASEKKFNEYLERLTDIIVKIASLGDSVVLFPTQLRADILVINELQPVLNKMCPADVRKRITIASIDGLESQLTAMSEYDLIIATRFHGVLMSYLVGKPAIGISYHPKISDLTAYMGHPECALPIDPLDVEAVLRTYVKLKARLENSQKTVLIHRDVACKELAAMYDQMFRQLLPSAKPGKQLTIC